MVPFPSCSCTSRLRKCNSLFTYLASLGLCIFFFGGGDIFLFCILVFGFTMQVDKDPWFYLSFLQDSLILCFISFSVSSFMSFLLLQLPSYFFFIFPFLFLFLTVIPFFFSFSSSFWKISRE